MIIINTNINNITILIYLLLGKEASESKCKETYFREGIYLGTEFGYYKGYFTVLRENKLVKSYKTEEENKNNDEVKDNSSNKTEKLIVKLRSQLNKYDQILLKDQDNNQKIEEIKNVFKVK